jgi:hypothetical protein
MAETASATSMSGLKTVTEIIFETRAHKKLPPIGWSTTPAYQARIVEAKVGQDVRILL